MPPVGELDDTGSDQMMCPVIGKTSPGMSGERRPRCSAASPYGLARDSATTLFHKWASATRGNRGGHPGRKPISLSCGCSGSRNQSGSWISRSIRNVADRTGTPTAFRAAIVEGQAGSIMCTSRVRAFRENIPSPVRSPTANFTPAWLPTLRFYFRNSLGAKSASARRHVCHSWSVPSDST